MNSDANICWRSQSTVVLFQKTWPCLHGDGIFWMWQFLEMLSKKKSRLHEAVFKNVLVYTETVRWGYSPKAEEEEHLDHGVFTEEARKQSYHGWMLLLQVVVCDSWSARVAKWAVTSAFPKKKKKIRIGIYTTASRAWRGFPKMCSFILCGFSETRASCKCKVETTKYFTVFRETRLGVNGLLVPTALGGTGKVEDLGGWPSELQKVGKK